MAQAPGWLREGVNERRLLPTSASRPVGAYKNWGSSVTWFHQYKHIFWRNGREVLKRANSLDLSGPHPLSDGPAGERWFLRKTRGKNPQTSKLKIMTPGCFVLAPPSLFIYDPWLVQSFRFELPLHQFPYNFQGLYVSSWFTEWKQIFSCCCMVTILVSSFLKLFHDHVKS